MTEEHAEQFEKEVAIVINRLSLENYTNTPDFILAAYLRRCLDNYQYVKGRNDLWWWNNPQTEETK